MANKILITGAAGFIGSHLVDFLREKKIPYKNLRLVIAPWDTLDNIVHHPLNQLEIIRADIRNKQVMKAAVKGVDVIYHLAARIDFDGKSYADYEDINVTATQHLLDAAKDNKLQKFVFFSSIGVFGLPAGIGNIEGWDETHPKTFTNHYGESKWEGEKRVMRAYEKYGIPYAIVRPASVYGPREKGPTLGLYKAIKNHRFVMIGNGQNKMHYVYVKDLVEGAYLAQTSKRKTGDYILAGPQPTRFKTLVQQAASSINETIPSWSIPKQLASLGSHGLAAVGSLTGWEPPLFPSRVKTMTTTYYYDISKAKKELGYQPKIATKQGMRETGRWYLEHGWL